MMPKYGLGNKKGRGSLWACSTVVSMCLIDLPKYTQRQELEELQQKISVLCSPLQESFIIMSKSIYCSIDVRQSYMYLC